MVNVSPDMKIDTESTTTKRAQEGILELLLANHPLDCPVCDKGGECPLQDQAFSHGPGESRYVEEKRHFEKPIPISDLVNLDRERCILCDRCTRFADEVAGDALIHFVQRGNDTQVMTFPDLPFSSYFSGNTVQICPVGALTAQPYRFKARPWDLTQSESTCTTCSVGCRTLVQSSRDEVLRYQGVDIDPVNWGWLCDRGRFNFEAVNSDDRLRAPLVRGEGGLEETSWSAALDVAVSLFDAALDAGGPDGVAFLGGARFTNESAYAWAQLADALGINRRDAQLGDGLPATLLDLPRATIDDAAAAATVVLVGPDVKEELPVLYLRLRHAATQGHDQAGRAVDVGDRADAVRVAIGPGRVGQRRRRAGRPHRRGRGRPTGVRTRRRRRRSRQPGRVRGIGGGDGADRARHRPGRHRAAGAAAGQRRRCPPARVASRCGRARRASWPRRPRARSICSCCSAPTRWRTARTPISLVARWPGPVGSSRSTPSSPTRRRRPMSCWPRRLTPSRPAPRPTSKVGCRRSAPEVTPTGTSRPDWMIASELADRLGLEDLAEELSGVDRITDSIAANVAAYAGATRGRVGRCQVMGCWPCPLPRASRLVDNTDGAADRNAYDYRLMVSRRLYDAAIGTAKSPSLASLAGDTSASINPLDLDRLGIPAGTDVTLTGPRGRVVASLAADARVPRGTVRLPFNTPGVTPGDLIDTGAAVLDVRIERLR